MKKLSINQDIIVNYKETNSQLDIFNLSTSDSPVVQLTGFFTKYLNLYYTDNSLAQVKEELSKISMEHHFHEFQTVLNYISSILNSETRPKSQKNSFFTGSLIESTINIIEAEVEVHASDVDDFSNVFLS